MALNVLERAHNGPAIHDRGDNLNAAAHGAGHGPGKGPARGLAVLAGETRFITILLLGGVAWVLSRYLAPDLTRYVSMLTLGLAGVAGAVSAWAWVKGNKVKAGTVLAMTVGYVVVAAQLMGEQASPGEIALRAGAIALSALAISKLPGVFRSKEDAEDYAAKNLVVRWPRIGFRQMVNPVALVQALLDPVKALLRNPRVLAFLAVTGVFMAFVGAPGAEAAHGGAEASMASGGLWVLHWFASLAGFGA